MKALDWDDLKVLVALANGGSVRAAASVLGVHHSTVARRLDHLETQVGAVLFTRTPQGLRLSREAEPVLEHARRVEAEINALERSLVGTDQRLAGSVRITMPDAIAVGFLMRELAEFTQAYPEIHLEILPTCENLDLSKREADVAIRVTNAPPEHLIGRPVGRFTVGVYASRKYLESHEPHVAPESCNWITWSRAHGFDEEIKKAHFPAIPSRTRCENVLLLMSAAAAGVGLAVLPCGLGDHHRSLVRVEPVTPIEAQEIWLLTHPDLRSAARVSTLMSFVAEAFAHNRDLLMGTASWDKTAPHLDVVA